MIILNTLKMEVMQANVVCVCVQAGALQAQVYGQMYIVGLQLVVITVDHIKLQYTRRYFLHVKWTV